MVKHQPLMSVVNLVLKCRCTQTNKADDWKPIPTVNTEMINVTIWIEMKPCHYARRGRIFNKIH